MHKVYSNAELNICASKSDQDQGLFSSRSSAGPQPLQVEIPPLEDDDVDEYDDGSEYNDDSEDHDSKHYLIRQECSNEIIKIWKTRVNDSPLASRGWVFQEQLLSRANLHFGDHEVLFECLETRASESLGSDEDYRLFWMEGVPFFKEHLLIPSVVERRRTSSDETDVLHFDYTGNSDDYTRWHDLLEKYTARQLTEFSDRLVALSGVAQYFQNAFSEHDHDHYIAGLWHSHLATEMLWQVTEAASRENWETRKTKCPYLTFSWVHVEGEVENETDLFAYSDYLKIVADLEPINYRLSPEPWNATGGEGQPFTEDIFTLPSTPTVEIRLTDFLRPMTLDTNAFSLRGRINPLLKVCEDKDWESFSWRWARPRWFEGLTSLDFELSSSERALLKISGRLFFMPLVAMDGLQVWLLLLELLETSDGKDMGRFRRIGVHKFSLFGEEEKKWLREWLPSEDCFSSLPCWRYDDRAKHHTIFVI